MLKNGIKAYHALEVTKVQEEATGYELLVATKPIITRGATLGGQ